MRKIKPLDFLNPPSQKTMSDITAQEQTKQVSTGLVETRVTMQVHLWNENIPADWHLIQHLWGNVDRYLEALIENIVDFAKAIDAPVTQLGEILT